jgi:hypothetical protein
VTDPDQTLRRYLEHFRRRVLTDALLEGTHSYWIRRAQAFEDASPREGDHPGQATDTDLDQQTQQLTDLAIMCRHHAQLLRETGLDQAATATIEAILAESYGQVA